MGVRDGTLATARLMVETVRTRVRRRRLKFKPLRVGPGELAAALGTAGVGGALRTAMDAMPAVAGFADRLEELTGFERDELLAVAKRVADHTFDLLGSGPTSLGERIDWSRDFKSGRAWPLDHISRVTVIYPDNSDVKVPWELSRFQHLPVLAAAYRLTGDRTWLDEIRDELLDWIAANPVEFGVNWACTMDVAIRAANWTATLALLGPAARSETWTEPALASLLLHGRFIRSHLEGGPCAATTTSPTSSGSFVWRRSSTADQRDEPGHGGLPLSSPESSDTKFARMAATTRLRSPTTAS